MCKSIKNPPILIEGHRMLTTTEYPSRTFREVTPDLLRTSLEDSGYRYYSRLLGFCKFSVSLFQVS